MGTALSIGQLLSKRYLVEQKLATGGQATLYRVTDRRITGKTWALKAYRASSGNQANAHEQWRSEIEVLRRRKHRSLPRLGEHFEDGGFLYLVLEYLDGQTLESLIGGGTACASEKTVLSWVEDLADVLTCLHRPDADDVRFVYADLKPQNIMRTTDGRLYLIDFGSARLLQGGVRGVPSLRLGTPGFAAPEQVRTVSESTDIFGLGATLISLLTGQTIDRFPPGTPLVGPQGLVTPALGAILRRATAFDPAQRYASIEQMREALQALAQVCLTCGTLTRPGAQFCPACGTSRTGLAQGPHPQTALALQRSVELRPTEFEQDRIEHHPVLNRLRLPTTAPLKLLLLRAEGERIALDRGFEDGLIALDALHIDTYAHQHNAVLTMLRDMRGNGIFADEVGLGKTIEAGMVLKELLVRGLVRKILILVRPGTTDQWQAEMQEKINEHFTIYDSQRKWRPAERIIISLDTARQTKRRDQFIGKTFDLVIVDEAHRLYKKSGEPNTAWHFVNALQRKYLLLLTATPIRAHLSELFSLVTLVRPGQFGSRQNFLQRYADTRAPDKAQQRQELKTVLADVMIRQRRRESTIPFPQKREIELRPIPLQGDERRCYALVEAAIRLDCSRDHLAHTWERLSTYRPLLQAACIGRQAVRDFLLARQTLHEQPHWQQVLAAVSTPGSDAKALALRDLLLRLHDRAIVYVDHPATARWLHRFLRLSHPSLEVALYLQERDRREALHQFRQHTRGVLLAGRPVEEGLNLQWCHLVINYDLPWDPTRLEQRIGRVHRLGQLQDVSIYSLVSQGTYAEHLLHLYRSSLRLFDLEVGELGMVLDELEDRFLFERALWDLWLTHPDPAAQAQALTALGTTLAQARLAFEHTRRGADTINAIFEG
ncbi:MAG TPA: SNF2-related protein [Ktedonobacterales bacterium]|nr:SNF2-related protein [Ktedonobacterales bacterium]